MAFIKAFYGDELENVNASANQADSYRALDPVEKEKAEAILEVFEKADDLEKLNVRINLTHYWRGIAPLYSIDILAEKIVEFADHLQHEKETLVHTGHQKATFSPSPWLDCRLSKLYPIKMPFGLKTVKKEQPYIKVKNNGRLECPPWYCYHLDNLPQTESGNIKTEYLWSETSKDKEPAAYDDAPFMQGIKPEFAVWIESLRDQLLKLKMETLDVLSKYLRRGDSNGMWDEIFDLLCSYVDYEEASTLTR